MAEPAPRIRTLAEDIQQSQFSSEAERTLLNLVYTANAYQYFTAQQLKPFGLTLQQYNILRILRGQKQKPISLLEVKLRMMDKSSDASRVTDRLVQKELVDRRECPNDRRAVDLTITSAGLEILAEIDILMANIDLPLQGLSPEELAALNILLDKARAFLCRAD